MKKYIFLLIIILFNSFHAEARHLKGGWIRYEYLGNGVAPNSSKYRITVYQYLDCSSVGPQIDETATLGIFLGDTFVPVETLDIDSVKNGSVILNKTTYDACITPKPQVCYLINKYVLIKELPNYAGGYILAVQRCCRIDGIVNVLNSNTVGVTYYNKIPGTINGVNYWNNSSPSFAQKDTTLICYKAPFTLDFSANDIDGDSLVYTFCDGLTGGSDAGSSGAGVGPKPYPPSSPPYASIPYSSANLNGDNPLGLNANINPQTGIISGTAPTKVGDYVVAVCVLEYRNGEMIGSAKKEIHVTVGNCSLSAAQLKPTYINCKDLNFTFFNESTASNIISYIWNFGDTLSPKNTDSVPKPIHSYTDTGIFKLTLKVVSRAGCVDSTKSLVKVYPGFQADFIVDSTCIQNPYFFSDSTYSKYGKVNAWLWNMGEPNVTNDTFSVKNPSYIYPTLGIKTVTLNVSNSNGCTDNITKTITVTDKPAINLSVKDTLICYRDSVPLQAYGSGNFTWSPTDSLSSPNTANTLVFPKDTTIYKVTVTKKGCTNTDSVRVNVLKAINVKAGPDTIVCVSDSVRLFAISHGTNYNWTSSNKAEIISAVSNPWITPKINPTYYYVMATLGRLCKALDAVLIQAFPYPLTYAGIDEAICYGKEVQLRGFATGSIFHWSPTNSLTQPDGLNPIAHPETTTTYVLTTQDTVKLGCARPISDTIVVRVVPKLKISVGNDTAVVANQPLQMNVTGNMDTLFTSYFWYPTKGLNNNSFKNPISTLSSTTDSITYMVKVTTPEGCYAYDTVKVVVFKTDPELFVPDAFTPNGDGLNDVERPIAVGVMYLDFFSVYNRWGQLIFTTNQIGRGWDGNFNGVAQPAGTYVYITQGRNYKGKTISKKGTFVLIR